MKNQQFEKPILIALNELVKNPSKNPVKPHTL
jgi:hypothetical protein